MGCRLILLCVATLASIAGCAGSGSEPATQPVSAEPEVDPAHTTAAYWYSQPDNACATASDFDALWAAAEKSARFRLFDIDRRDPRNGVLTSIPVVSSQVFEPWRQDQCSAYDTAQSSLASIRRTIRFEITRQDNGMYQLTPKVLVERFSQAENRITNVVLYRGAFKVVRTPETAAYGSRETDRGVFLDGRYWYATGRDQKLEAALAADVQKTLSAPAN